MSSPPSLFNNFKLVIDTKANNLFSDAALEKLIQLKASERKDDPERQQGLHGPYEEVVIAKTGRLPQGYYEENDSEPWGLLVRESRSNILWQVTSGMMDKYPEFGAVYMALALDHALAKDEYARELSKINKDWRKYAEHAGVLRDHSHRPLKAIYQSVSCPACSVLTALASQDAGMIALFKEMSEFKPIDRIAFLNSKGLLPYLNTMVSDLSPQFANN